MTLSSERKMYMHFARQLRGKLSWSHSKCTFVCQGKSYETAHFNLLFISMVKTHMGETHSNIH